MIAVVDRHRRGDTIQRNAVKQCRHVFDRIDRDANASHLAGGQRMVRVVADLRREVERDAQSADTLQQQIPVAPVRLGGVRKARVLPHRPRTAAVHGRLHTTRERERAGRCDVFLRVEV
jgi:hypothetical protein